MMDRLYYLEQLMISGYWKTNEAHRWFISDSFFRKLCGRR